MFGWKSEGFSEQNIITPATSGNSFTPKLTCVHNFKTIVKFAGNCFEKGKVSFTHRNVVNGFIVYELDIWLHDLNTDLALKDCLFGAVKLTKNAYPDKYRYSRYGSGFNSRSIFLISNFDFGKNVFFFFWFIQQIIITCC